MVVIRLSRSGAKKNPYYFITVADSRNARDGAFIERLGFYNPSAKGQEETLRIDIEKIDEWVSKGAQVSDRVKRLIKDSKLSAEELDARKAAKKDKADAKKAAALAAKQEEIKKQAEEEGIDKILKDAGFEWREAGCSMCLGMNPDQLKPGERCASTSNRNFEGRQGRGGRTHLMSPELAAASAITGNISDIRDFT